MSKDEIDTMIDKIGLPKTVAEVALRLDVSPRKALEHIREVSPHKGPQLVAYLVPDDLAP